MQKAIKIGDCCNNYTVKVRGRVFHLGPWIRGKSVQCFSEEIPSIRKLYYLDLDMQVDEVISKIDENARQNTFSAILMS